MAQGLFTLPRHHTNRAAPKTSSSETSSYLLFNRLPHIYKSQTPYRSEQNLLHCSRRIPLFQPEQGPLIFPPLQVLRSNELLTDIDGTTNGDLPFPLFATRETEAPTRYAYAYLYAVHHAKTLQK